MIIDNNEQNSKNLLFDFDDYLRQIKELRKKFENEKKFASGKTQVLGWDLEYINAPSLSNSLELQILARINDFYSTKNNPLILDCGANIGISTLNYKRQYPNARIISFEPDPNFLPVLKRNLEQNGAADVQIIDAAVWTRDGETQWFCEGIDGSRIVSGKQNVSSTITVKTIDIAKYISEEVDLMKMDIEGAEFEVIEYLSDKLGLVKNLVVECHIEESTIGPFGKLLGILKSAGFSVAFNTYGPWRDLIRQPAPYYDIENYVLVAAWKDKITQGLPVNSFFPNTPFYIQETFYEMDSIKKQLTSKELEISSKEQEISSKIAFYDSLFLIRTWRMLKKIYHKLIGMLTTHIS